MAARKKKKKTTRKKKTTVKAAAAAPEAPPVRSPGGTPPDLAEVTARLAKGEVRIHDLQQLGVPELLVLAEQEEIPDAHGLTKQDLIFQLLKSRGEGDGELNGEGVLEILPDGFGFLRSPLYSYTASPDDIYVSPSQIRRLGLRSGSFLSGQIRPPKDGERYFA
ncbi:MAG: Rho termination factor N-terminal domain-containing protein, partial [Planctomycetota bacterium]